MANKNIKQVFNSHIKVRVDKKWLKELLTWVRGFEFKSDEHISFLGSNLLGINRVMYMCEDETIFMDDLLSIDNIDKLERDFHDLNSVDSSRIVTGSLVNMCYVYTAHLILASKLKDNEKEMGLVAIFKMLHYKFMASIFYHFFKYKTQEALALATYESLSNKSLLKREGTWGKLVIARANDIIAKDSIHIKTLKQMGTDESLLYVVSDIQTRIKAVIISLTKTYYELREEDTRIMSKSKFINTEDGVVLREYTNNVDALITNMIKITGDRNDFVRRELIDRTIELVTTANDRHLEHALVYMSENINNRDDNIVKQLITNVTLYIHSLSTSALNKNAVDVIVTMRNVIRSSQTNNPKIISIKDTVSTLIDKGITSNSATTKSSTKIAVLVYITLRIITFNHYS